MTTTAGDWTGRTEERTRVLLRELTLDHCYYWTTHSCEPLTTDREDSDDNDDDINDDSCGDGQSTGPD